MNPEPLTAAAQPVIGAQQPLVFVHIPKTGGMSLFTALAEHFGTAIADLYNMSPRNAGLAMRALADPARAVYCGHFSFGMHEWLTRPACYAAVVREPVARLVSLYHYCQPMLESYRKRLDKAGGRMEVLWRDTSLSDFYLDFEVVLRGDRSPEAFFASPSAELDNGMVRRFSGWGLDPRPCPASALETAKANIERHFSVVGVLERYPETLELMARVFQLPGLRENKVNANKERPPDAEGLPEATLARIREMNALDLALYDWVLARFDAKLAAPPAAVAVPGGGRTDAAAIPLWRSVGNSPLREIAMRNRGHHEEPSETWRLVQIGRVAHSRRHVQIDTVMSPDGDDSSFIQRRLKMSPLQTKRLLATLQAALKSYEQHHGRIDD